MNPFFCFLKWKWSDTAKSSVRWGEMMLSGLNPSQIADGDTGSYSKDDDDRYEYYSLLMRIDKSQVSPQDILLGNGSVFDPHPHIVYGKSLEEEQKDYYGLFDTFRDYLIFQGFFFFNDELTLQELRMAPPQIHQMNFRQQNSLVSKILC